MRHYRGILVSYLIIILLGACAAQKNGKLIKEIDQSLALEIFENNFTGILFYEPATKDTVYKNNSHKYFTPASNTKIFTLYSALKLLPKKLPVLKYSKANDTIYIAGTGDATQLHPYFQDSTILKFLKGFRNISLYTDNLEDAKFGPGWAWEDYHWYYSAERSALPLYGNVVTVDKSEALIVRPEYFRDSIIMLDYSRNRKADINTFFFDPVRKDTLEIPFITDSNLSKELLQQALGKTVNLTQQMPDLERTTVFGIAADSVYKRMMQESDNFLAEQLLIQASTSLSDTLSSRKTREYVLDSLLSDLKQPPRWVDGSGLSRYNLFSPESLVQVLEKLYIEIPRNRLFNIFAVGGVSGTLESWYAGNPNPYIYAKTGTLGNNHCLSGYLITRSGRTLIFSFMNNHFRTPTPELKEQMQKVFERIRDHY